MCTALSLQERGLLATAEALAELIAGRPVAAQLAPFAIERF